jgi:hypothetical protein
MSVESTKMARRIPRVMLDHENAGCGVQVESANDRECNRMLKALKLLPVRVVT